MVIESSKVDFGRWDADIDDKLFSAYVHTSSVARIRSERIIFVEGLKGSGKTAITRHRADEYMSQRVAVIEADDLKFPEIVTLFDNASRDRKLNTRVFERAWKVTFHDVFMEMIVRAIGEGLVKADDDEKKVLESYLQRPKNGRRSVTSMLFRYLCKLVPSIAGAKNGLSDEDLDKLIDQVESPVNLADAREVAQRVLKYSNTRWYIGFDKLDRYFEDATRRQDVVAHEMLQVFVVSLMYAVYDLSNDPLFRDVDFKVMLPLDKVLSLRIRDGVKLRECTHRIRWT